MPRRLALALLLLVPATASAQAQVPEGLSRAEPVSVAGETIALAEIRRWARIAARSSGGERRPPGLPELAQAADLLVRLRWIEGEAAAVGVRVGDRQVRRKLRAQREDSFPSRRAFRRFLRESHQTLADIRFRVRLDMLSNRIRHRVIRGIDDPAEQQARLLAFVEEFDARWKAQTRCSPLFTAIAASCASG